MAEFDLDAVEAAWREAATDAFKALIVTSAEGVTLQTFSATDDPVALPAPLIATVVRQASKMRVGRLESLVAVYDRLCLVTLVVPPFAATVVASEQVDPAQALALRPGLVAAVRGGDAR
mmetsp:Transcript_26947/g.80793  ORF Transcript_26947/g.80793 Transcript_26947/m.80793 type:complete len:119 (-) Transcript_26947:28-384(-)